MTVVVVSTGGTIASVEDEGGDAKPELSADELVEAVPELAEVAKVETHDFSTIPSQHLTLDKLYDLAQLVREFDADPSIEGIVVTQGTNSMEESAYFVDLCYDGDTPLVFTGAMRNPSLVSPEGPANLLASVMTATEDRARETGALVVANDRIHPAREVTKAHSMNVDTFRSPEFGPLGTIDEDHVTWRRLPENPDPTMDPDPDALTGDVRIVTATVAMDDALLRACTDAAGVVVATMGPGHLPESAVEALREVRAADVPVFATTRSHEGRLYRARYFHTGSEYLLRELRCYYGDLNPQKTRIRAIVALAADRVDDAFELPDPPDR